MASENRATRHDLNLLRDKPYKFNFFHALRLIECVHKDNPKLGCSKRPADDPIRLGQAVSMAFETSTLAEFKLGKEGRPPRLTQRFFGLYGANAPMPLHITEYVRGREYNNHDNTLARFSDVFHHRMLCLFYKARADTEPTFQFDRPDKDRFADYVGALLGIAQPEFKNRDAMPDIAKLHYSGFLSNQVKNVAGLKNVLADYFKLPVSVEEFVGEWLTIEPSEQTRLGLSPQTGTLGISTVIGSKVWSCQHKFRIVFGALTQEEYESLLPSGKRLEALIAIVRNYIGDEMSWDVRLILKKEEVSGVSLNQGARLGWTSWVGHRESKEDASELLLNPFI
ncbi:MAG: type VI secretion system baseplate subunit TssG [Methylococcaceae bacterium]|nr:type VI secretion system baseplate subunit TssG [Methylococcaceae bacterium]